MADKHIDLESVVARRDDVLYRVLDEEAVLVDLTTGHYFGLNKVGTWIWNRIDAPTKLSTLLDALVQEFEVEREVAQGDLLALLKQLEEKQLVRLERAGGPP